MLTSLVSPEAILVVCGWIKLLQAVQKDEKQPLTQEPAPETSEPEASEPETSEPEASEKPKTSEELGAEGDADTAARKRGTRLTVHSSGGYLIQISGL